MGFEMKKLLTLGLVLFLTGCAPAKMIAMKQTSCESQFSKFEDVVSCTKEAYKKDGMARDSENTKDYFLKGEELVQKLKKGEITEADARAEWQQTLGDMTEIEPLTDNPSDKITLCRPASGEYGKHGGMACNWR